jgi:uncharacterized integral membrane protein
LFWIIAVPLLALAGAFAAANHGPVSISLWPLPYKVDIPVYAAVLGAFIGGVVITTLYAWIHGLPVRLERRRLARQERALAEETVRLRARLAETENRAGGPTLDIPNRDAKRRLISAEGD